MIPILIVLGMLLLASQPVLGEDAQDTPLYIGVSGDLVSATGETHTYVITCLGGPGEREGGTYSMNATFIGDDTYTGSIDPGSADSDDGLFYVNVTMPTTAQTLGIEIDIASADGGDFVIGERTIYVRLIDPIVISSRVTNTGDVDAEDVDVAFYDGDTLIHTATVDVDAGKTVDVVYNWTDQNVASGTHAITVSVDPDNHFVRFDNGMSTYTTTVYKGETSYSFANTMLGIIIVLLVVSLAIVYRRPVVKKKKGKKKKKKGKR